MNLPNNNVWQNRLTRNMNGEALCTMPNIALILKSDPNLKNIVFNEMKKTLDIIGAVPWKTEASGWDTTDFPCLQCIWKIITIYMLPENVKMHFMLH